MNFGYLILAIAFLLTAAAVIHQGWWWLLLWPAFSFALVAAGYLVLGTRVFGKTGQGTIAPLNRVLLFPYLFYLNGVWHVLRRLRSEPAVNQLSETLFISRRLFSDELPEQIEHVIDLTCEFNEPAKLRKRNYLSCPILDRGVPALHELQSWIPQIAALKGTILIHCAEGHGRTGLFTAALLIYQGHAESPDAALDYIQSRRPEVRLSGAQKRLLREFCDSG
ncbi:hypothetical protein Pan241w_09660 [Gimesia alba]|uniref:Tyrosine specific protein phosphatases domain-containing protein n=1 Tax=Gimesia alba TaxID=2527973 RepID=A0A517RAI6_9PLAN|nr:dual specificity protein phosphatase family protein [Gimesia alba]QDT40907.1 hypothetical protein Pan241w_09660 [Gimesia alba]